MVVPNTKNNRVGNTDQGAVVMNEVNGGGEEVDVLNHAGEMLKRGNETERVMRRVAAVRISRTHCDPVRYERCSVGRPRMHHCSLPPHRIRSW